MTSRRKCSPRCALTSPPEGSESGDQAGDRPRAALAMAVLSALTLGLLATQGHASQAPLAAGSVAVDAVHLGAVAIWIGRTNFHAAVTPRLTVFPVILVGGIAIALLAALLPISLLRRVQPANILRGE